MTTKPFTDNAEELVPAAFDSVHSCLVLAPHPDDESLGCGGFIAMLRERGKDVFVVFTTDGSGSHRNSKKYPSQSLTALRKSEAMAALAVLGVNEKNIFFLDKKDGSLPAEGEDKFEENAAQLHLLISLLQPELILLPYQKDPHRDHRATWQMLMHSRKDSSLSFRILEYTVWLFVRGETADMPDVNTLYYLNIEKYKARKNEAIQKHVSQTTNLIDDDPKGFVISDDMLRFFDNDKEFYIDRNL